MPDVRGRSLAAARAALQAAGLKTTVTRATSAKPAGTVVDEAPKPGAKIAKGSTVTLSVAHAPATTAQTTTQATTTTAPTTTAAAPAPPQNATMPDVSHQNEQSAVQAMSRAGILASLVFVPAQDELGTVERQAKPAGTTVPFHSHVQLNISRGPNTNFKSSGCSDATVVCAANMDLFSASNTIKSDHFITGFTVNDPSLGGKWVELLKEIAPRTQRVALLFNPATTVPSNTSCPPFKLPHHPLPSR